MTLKKIRWIGKSKDDLKKFPEKVQDTMGSALLTVQWGDTPENAKPLKGFGSAKILEIIDIDKSGTFRVVYTVKFVDAVYVLHSFQKKSKHGIETPKEEIDLVKARLKIAEEISKRK